MLLPVRPIVLALVLASVPFAHAAETFQTVSQGEAILLRDADGKEVLAYQRSKPADSLLAVESGCYAHPFRTPKGFVVTDVAPSDHLHHRGIFLAWVEMHGDVDADFWGWGEHAPIKGRAIRNRAWKPRTNGFEAANDWMAGDTRVIEENLTASLTRDGNAHVLDLDYRLKPQFDITVSQWAFSGFCVRSRKDVPGRMFDPDGPVKLPAPSHLEPSSDWPDRSWYALHFETPEGGAGVAVIPHRDNPPALWHNHPDLRMLNPATCAPGPMQLKSGTVVTLRYRVVAYDGPLDRDHLSTLSRGFQP